MYSVNKYLLSSYYVAISGDNSEKKDLNRKKIIFSKFAF